MNTLQILSILFKRNDIKVYSKGGKRVKRERDGEKNPKVAFENRLTHPKIFSWVIWPLTIDFF
jgi:hypothetical protein